MSGIHSGRGRRALILMAGAAMIASLVATTASAVGDARQSAAVEALSRYVSVEGAKVTGPVDGVASTYYEVVAPSFVSRVDATSGEVVSLTRFDASPVDKKTSIANTDAEANADSFLRLHGIDVAGMTMTGGRQDDGGMTEYLYQWQAWDGSIRLPHAIAVAINPASGQVFQYVNYQRTYSEPPAPKRSQAEAESAARSAIGVDGAAVDETVLAITFDASGRQYLGWEVRLSASNKGGWIDRTIVVVDATTGETEIVGQG